MLVADSGYTMCITGCEREGNGLSFNVVGDIEQMIITSATLHQWHFSLNIKEADCKMLE